MATSAQINAIVALYAGYFDRAPDPAGLQFWIDQIDAGRDFATIAQDFANGPEAKALYPFLTVPDVATASTFVTAVYQNLFGRAPDAEGLAFWTKVIEDQTVPVGDMIQAIINGAVTDPDATVLANKAAAGLDFATQAGDTLGFVYDAAAAAAAKAVMDGITADPATVDAAKAATDVFLGGVENIGTTYQLTTGVDNVPGTTANDIINGHVDTIANGGTFNGVDNIDGSIGVDTMNISVIDDGAWPAAALVKNVEILNVRNVDATPTSLSLGGFTGLQQAWSKGSTADTTFTSASTATTFGLVGTTDLTVDFATTSGKTDTANLALAGVGTSAAARSTVNVADGDTVEAVTVAASGTNFVSLEAGSAAATITVTGNGTNNIAVTSAAPSLTLDASTSTGANTLEFGTVLSTTDVIKGGTGADTLVANLTVPSLLSPTITGVESLSLDFDAAATLNLSKTTGATTATLAGSSASQTITNAGAELATVNITSQVGTSNDLNLSYATGASADLTMNIGGTADIQMDDFTLTRVGSLTFNAVGTKNNTIDDVSVGSLTALNVNAGTDGNFNAGNLNVAGDIGVMNVDVAAGGDADFNTYASGGNVGDVNVAVNGNGAVSDVYVDSDGSSNSRTFDIGNMTLTVNGDDTSGYLEGDASSGSVGDVTATVTGSDASGVISAYASAGYDGAENTLGGDIGNVLLEATGTSSYVSGYIEASGGNVGTIDMNVTGKDAEGSAYIYTYGFSADASGAQGDNGNIGNIAVNLNGESASAYVSAYASSGNIGDITIDAQGSGAWAVVSGGASDWGGSGVSAGASGDVGNITITVGDDANVSANIDSSGSVGNTVVTGGDNADMYVNVSGYYGSVGDMTVTMGEDSYFSGGIDTDDADVGSISITAGADAYVSAYIESYSGSIGTVDITVGANSDVYLSGSAGSGGTTAGDLNITAEADTYVSAYYDVSGNTGNFTITADDVDLGVYATSGNVGSITITEASTAADDIVMYVSAGSVVEVDTTGFNNGDATIDLSGVTLGTTISVGNGGSDIDGTAGADNIFGGTGIDVIRGGAGVDVMQGNAGADVFDFTDVDAAASVSVVTDIIMDFVSGTDKLEFDNITGDYAEELAATATFVDLLAAAETALDGTVDFYFGVFNGNGYLFADEDGIDNSITTIIELTGVTDMADTDFV
ncbi:MAG: DUF4214 domain-containing protein [Sulfitobacter sp.]|nr:DUF4214 domain-containing protein [Sulfitobacter sp.]